MFVRPFAHSNQGGRFAGKSFVGGYGPNVHRSTDGRTWVTETLSPVSGHLSWFACAPGGTALAISTNRVTVARTTDYGETWTVLPEMHPIGSNVAYGVDYVGEYFIAYGSNRLAVSQDGLNWQPHVVLPQTGFVALAYKASESAYYYIVSTSNAANGNIYRSTNFQTWTLWGNALLGGRETIHRPRSFVIAENGRFGVGYSPAVVESYGRTEGGFCHSVDGSTSWIHVALAENNLLNRLECRNNYIVGVPNCIDNAYNVTPGLYMCGPTGGFSYRQATTVKNCQSSLVATNGSFALAQYTIRQNSTTIVWNTYSYPIPSGTPTLAGTAATVVGWDCFPA